MTREEALPIMETFKEYDLEPKEREALDKAIEALKEERPHGEWIENTRYKRKGKKFLDCSRCHYGENGDIICEVSKVPNYCPNCGASMRKEGDEK